MKRTFHRLTALKHWLGTNTSDMLSVDAKNLCPLLRQLRWKLPFESLVPMLTLLFEMDVPLSYMLLLDHLLSHADLNYFKNRQLIIETLPLMKNVMRTVLDGYTDKQIDEVVLCVTRRLEDKPFVEL